MMPSPSKWEPAAVHATSNQRHVREVRTRGAALAVVEALLLPYLSLFLCKKTIRSCGVAEKRCASRSAACGAQRRMTRGDGRGRTQQDQCRKGQWSWVGSAL